MYIQSQDKQTMINFDNFHELYVNDNMVCAIHYQLDKKLNVVLGQYKDHEEAMRAFENIMNDMLDDGGKMEDVIIEVE